MIREQLIELASRASGESDTWTLCHAALRAGALFEIYEGATDRTRLLSIYRRRWRNAERAGQPSTGFLQALTDMENFNGEALILGYVDNRDRGGYYFQLFLSPDSNCLVACLGVKPSHT